MPADGNHLTFEPNADRTRIDALVRSIRAALTETGRPLPTDENAIAAAEAILVERGDLARAIEASGWGIKQGAAPYHVLLIVYRAAMAEIDDPARWVARLRRDEKALRALAEKHAKTAADYFGRVKTWAAAATEGDGWQRMGAAAEAQAVKALDEAAEMAADADRIAARVRRTADMFEIVTGSRAQVERAVL